MNKNKEQKRRVKMKKNKTQSLQVKNKSKIDRK